MRFGIVGYGKMGKIRHQALMEIDTNFDVMMWDIEGEHAHTSLDDLFTQSDAVFICTPTYCNAPMTKRGLENDCHVFCEKPPALNHNEILSVREVYNKFPDKTLSYGFNHRSYDSIIKMKEIVDSKRFGRILWMRGRYGKAMGDPNTGGWRADATLSGGGILIDQGIHMLDLMSFFGGPFSHVDAVVTNSMWDIEGMEDTAFVNLYNSDAHIAASVHSTMIEWRHIFSLEILLEKGYLALNGLKTPSGSYGREVLTIGQDKKAPQEKGAEETIEFVENKTWEKEVRGFVESIQQQKPSTNLNDAIEVMRIIEEVYHGRR